jgi:hypothetical protein
MSTNLIGISGYIGSGKDTFARCIMLAMYNKVYKNKGEFNEPTTSALRSIEILSKERPIFTNNWQIKKFAGPLKEITCILIGCTMEQLEDQKFKESTLGPEWDQEGPSVQTVGEWIEEQIKAGRTPRLTVSPTRLKVPITVREFLQQLGTEAMRYNLHENVWVNALFSKYKVTKIEHSNYYTEDYPKWIVTDMRFPNEMQAIKDHGGICIRLVRGQFPTSKHSSETSLDNRNDWDELVYNTGTLEDLYEKAKHIVNKYKLS